MQTFKILVEGYAHTGVGDYYVASPSCVLITERDKRVLVDPGANAGELKKSLKKEKVNMDDIDIVYLTHYHPDHFLNIRLFPDHDIYDGETRWHIDEEYAHSKTIPGTSIEILATPGHSVEHTSLLIKTADLGKVCVAQDVFWWEDGKQKSDSVEDLMNNEDPFMTDWEALQNSRKLVLSKADWIIPGHGKMFQNPSAKN